MCPGGEGAVLKTVGLKGLAGSNPVHGAIYGVIGEVINTLDCGSSMRRFNSYMAPHYGEVAKWSNAADCKSVLSGSMVQIHLSPPFYIQE